MKRRSQPSGGEKKVDPTNREWRFQRIKEIPPVCRGLGTHCRVPGKARGSLVDVYSPPGEAYTRFRSWCHRRRKPVEIPLDRSDIRKSLCHRFPRKSRPTDRSAKEFPISLTFSLGRFRSQTRRFISFLLSLFLFLARSLSFSFSFPLGSNREKNARLIAADHRLLFSRHTSRRQQPLCRRFSRIVALGAKPIIYRPWYFIATRNLRATLIRGI